MMRRFCLFSLLVAELLAPLGLCSAQEHGEVADGAEARWWKGNLHTHSLWSDGDDFPEMIVDWYKRRGYHFLALSDHNVLHQAQHWIAPGTNELRATALKKYLDRFGPAWVETRTSAGKAEVRLKPWSEYRSLFEENGRFLLIPSEEISDMFQAVPIHMNASNVRDYIPPQGGNSVREVMQNNVDSVFHQRRATGQLMIPHLNHPNFHFGVTAEDLARVRGEHFFEVYNGHPFVNDPGDTNHPSTERLWDIALSLRLTEREPEPLFGVAVDDAHNYHAFEGQQSNPGRGWIMVRARHLTAESILRAMELGDFYASSGVTLREVSISPTELNVQIQAEAGVTYRTQFVGTRRDADLHSDAVTDADGKPLPITRRYRGQIGEVLADVEGTTASYRFVGNELYVRARILSSKPKDNSPRSNDAEMAWTQPVFRSRNP